ncbi:SLC7A6 isoform 4, partial [Pongo abelii]
MEARQPGRPIPTYHLVPNTSQSQVEEDVSSPPQRSSETMQLKKEISLLNGLLSPPVRPSSPSPSPTTSSSRPSPAVIPHTWPAVSSLLLAYITCHLHS